MHDRSDYKKVLSVHQRMRPSRAGGAAAAAAVAATRTG